MKLSDPPTLDGRNPGGSACDSTVAEAAQCAELPTADDLRLLVAAADEYGLIALETLRALFAALERRDSATARHSYRTACWCVWLAMLARIPLRDTVALAVAALLHDIGKIGIEDEILLKPCELTQAESQIMRQYASLGTRISAACRTGMPVVAILTAADANSPADAPAEAKQAEHSHMARMLAVADAFDAMTSDQRYRRAMSRGEALQRLRVSGPRQFDPDVVSLLEFGLSTLGDAVTVPSGSLQDLIAGREQSAASDVMRTGTAGIVQALNLVSDAVCMVDCELRIGVWNERAATLTGYPSEEIVGRTWNNAWIDYVGQVSLPVEERRSLMTRCLAAGTLLTERGYLWNVRGDCIPVESRAMPVRDDLERIVGAIEIIRDLSREISLQSENEQLRRVSQIDPLTQVSNRTAFERILNEQVDAVNRTGARSSLILLDIDFFKSINDTFGHPVGDLVLKSFAKVLEQSIRPIDVVARYGGEEFAMLLPHCNLATAYERAERLRGEFHQLRVPELKGRGVTASLGVTEIQAGDGPATVVVRADEALYRAKERGRDRTEVTYADSTRQNDHAYSCSWSISGTADLALLKLSGFVRVWRAETLQSEPACIRFRIGRPSMLRRVGIRHGEMPVEVQLSFSRTHISERTQVQVAIRALVGRPAAEEFHARCCEILATLRSHLMADCASAPAGPSASAV